MMNFKAFALKGLAFVIAIVAAIAPEQVQAQQENGISVTVTPLTLNGRTTYQYRVVNNGSQRIVGLAIGNDYRYGVPELTVYPEGWNADTGIVPGTVLSPARWAPTVLTTEESAAVELRWRNDATADVMPGQTLAGFAVVVLGQSSLYLNSHWTAFLGDGTAAYGVLTQTGQPRLALAMAGLTQVSPGRFNAQLEVTNAGGSAALEVVITNILAKSLAGTGTVTVVDPPLPLQIGTLAAGSKTFVNVTLVAPISVKRISLTEQGTLKNTSGNSLNFSASVSAFTKQ